LVMDVHVGDYTIEAGTGGDCTIEAGTPELVLNVLRSHVTVTHHSFRLVCRVLPVIRIRLVQGLVCHGTLPHPTQPMT